MVTKQALQHRLTDVETQEPDRAWFAQRPARTHRMRLPTFDDLRDYGTKITHVIAVRREKTQISRVPITLTASVNPLHLSALLRDTAKDGVLDLNIAEVMHAIRGRRRISLEELYFKASKSFR